MNYIVFDLEATCWEHRSPDQRNEIIEIGAVKFDESGTTLDEFARFVRPTLSPTLSEFCKQLTSIKQAEVDHAAAFPQVLADFQQWIGESYVLCSWGFYDKKQLKHDCQLHELPIDWLKPHISVKHQYPQSARARQAYGHGKGAGNRRIFAGWHTSSRY